MSETNLAGSKLLTSWKEIAAFLGKGVRTVQRWETTLGLPIIRPNGSARNVVMARCDELEAWVLKGRREFRSEPATWMKKDEEARLKLTMCIEEFRRRMKEVEELVQEVAGTREVLREEIERFRSLFREWNTIRGLDVDAGDPPPPMGKVN